MPLTAVAAGIGALSSLIGGKKAAKEQARAIAAQNAYNHPSAIRARAEEAGFNPLLFVGPGVGTQTALAQPVMGQAIANAGLAIANGVSDWEAQRAQATALEKQNAELRKALETATLRPKVGGVWPAGATYVPATPAGVDATVLTGRPVKVVGGQTEYTTPGAPPVGALAFGEVEATSLYAPYLGRNGEVLQFQEGTDLEDAASAVPMNALANLQADGTIDRGFVDRFFLNAENLTTAIARPVFNTAKGAARQIVIAGQKMKGQRPLVDLNGRGSRRGFASYPAGQYNPWGR